MTVVPQVMEARARGVAVVPVLPGLMVPVVVEVVLVMSADKQETVPLTAVQVNPAVSLMLPVVVALFLPAPLI
ncbi:hypothetical protein A2376_01785 [Candidatus Woesebacteria bacterium RIFOXYB1_FULL_47_31]|uniref:Uncharacterized protein n=3 Tax=Candidatus Woeseibacteriota TaxID=1752722 RepID=A0A1F8D726_9BACT|nr:MAG: hypothetical protein A2376_01785 [Candidatus Woesebacteria bacterium RIFOXYB1_FULL_47_31]OGM85415.1 MAG: hypothetical protein A2435_02790 [Candidatus Woesebacteria bacterium RIFOXYC1_FULL_46_16]OGM90012.1 MAG: hypothetical protein A2597_01205 [Candidatus Woesebacteria bacterium RIFOXYD1_FULL_46_19]